MISKSSKKVDNPYFVKLCCTNFSICRIFHLLKKCKKFENQVNGYVILGKAYNIYGKFMPFSISATVYIHKKYNYWQREAELKRWIFNDYRKS